MIEMLEVIARVVVIYLTVLVLLRLGGKKELASLTPMELVTLLLISETVSPALVGGSDRLELGVLAAATLVGLTVMMNRFSYRFRWFERAVDGEARLLITDGHVHQDVLRRERITDDQLRTLLHENGVMSVSQVRRAFVEPSGEVTMIRRTSD